MASEKEKLHILHVRARKIFGFDVFYDDINGHDNALSET